MFRKNFSILAIAASISIPAIAIDLTPERYSFIKAVQSACSTGIEDCPDEAGIEILVSDISAAEANLESAQADLANSVSAVADAQAALDALAPNATTAQIASAEATLATAKNTQTADEGTVDSNQAILDGLNAKASALNESSTLKAVFDYYNSKSLITEQQATVAAAEQAEQDAKDTIPGLVQLVNDANTELATAIEDLATAQEFLDTVLEEELAKDDPDTARIEAATQAVDDATIAKANNQVAVGVAEVNKETGDASVLAAETATASAKEVLEGYNASTVSLGNAAKDLISSIPGNLDAKATHDAFLSDEQEKVATNAEVAKATAQQASANASAEVVIAQDALDDAIEVRNAARTALQIVDPTDLEALVAAANALDTANQAVTDASQDLADANQSVIDTGVALGAASAEADLQRGNADNLLLAATNSQANSVREKEFFGGAGGNNGGAGGGAGGGGAGGSNDGACVDGVSPAVPLTNSFISGDDVGGAIIDAVDCNYEATVTNAEGIAANVTAIESNDADIAANVTAIESNDADIAANVTDIATNASGIAANVTDIATNASGIAANVTSIGNNASAIANNGASIDDLERSMAINVDMLKSGIASSLAIAGLPTLAGEGFGFSIGVGYFEGENAAAMGLSHVSAGRTIKLSVGHANGNTSGSLGAAFKF